MARRHQAVAVSMLCTMSMAVLPAQRVLRATKEMTISAATNNMVGVGHMAISPRGVIVVSQPEDGQFLFFDATGKPLGKFGSKGEGPWEFKTLGYRTGFVADTFWNYDTQLHRLTWLFPVGKGLRMDRHPPTLLSPQGTSTDGILHDFYTLGPSADGGLLAFAYPAAPDKSQPWFPIGKTDRHLLIRYGIDGKIGRVIARDGPVDGQFCQWNSPKGAAFGSFGIPLCKSPEWALSPEGKTLIHLTNIVGDGYRVIILNAATGDTLGSRRLTVKPRPISSAKLDSVRETPKNFPPEFVAAYKGLVFPKDYPSVSTLVVGNDGSVWVEQNTDPKALRRWQILSRTGQDLGVLELPRNVHLNVAQLGMIWATMTDADGVEDVVRFRVQ